MHVYSHQRLAHHAICSKCYQHKIHMHTSMIKTSCNISQTHAIIPSYLFHWRHIPIRLCLHSYHNTIHMLDKKLCWFGIIAIFRFHRKQQYLTFSSLQIFYWSPVTYSTLEIHQQPLKL